MDREAPEIRECAGAELETFLALVREVYDEFVAGDYCPAGNATFYDFISPGKARERLERGNLMLAAWSGGTMVGALEVRSGDHIALFFVRTAWQGKGIGKRLFSRAADLLAARGVRTITVNSSPYAARIYERLGFVKTAEMQERDGIRYVPMEYRVP